MNDHQWHLERHKSILKKHPELKQYFHAYPPSMYFLIAVIALQWIVAYFMIDLAFWQIGLMAFFFGQFITHAIASFIHEASHNRIYKSKKGTLFSLAVIECGTLSFAKSLEYVAKHNSSHHRYLNEYEKDYEWWDREKVRTLKSKPKWRFIESLIHLLPAGTLLTDFLAMKNCKTDKNRDITRKDPPTWFNWSLISLSSILYIVAWLMIGWEAALYLLWSVSLMVGNWGITFKGQSIAEHDVKKNGKTFSTYGWVNYLFFNTGYHDEHHTFPAVPWIHLPKVRKIAFEDFQNDSGKDYIGWWFQWFASGFNPANFNRYRPQAEETDEKVNPNSLFPN